MAIQEQVVSVTATPTPEGVQIEGVGAVLLKSGDSIKISLVAEDGTKYDATVGIWRVRDEAPS